MKEEIIQERKEIFWEIMKVIDELTKYGSGDVDAKSLKKELLIQVFPEIPLEVININK